MQKRTPLVSLAVVALFLAMHQPAYGQTNAAPFSQCYEQIARAETEGRITKDKATSLRNELRNMQDRDAQLTRPGGHVREDSLWHGQIIDRVTAMIAELSQEPAGSPPANLARIDHPAAVSQSSATWPPRDAAGRIILGPQRGGTREQIGWPLYGWSREDYRRWQSEHAQK
jgi:hypothetical protein